MQPGPAFPASHRCIVAPNDNENPRFSCLGNICFEVFTVLVRRHERTSPSNRKLRHKCTEVDEICKCECAAKQGCNKGKLLRRNFSSQLLYLWDIYFISSLITQEAYKDIPLVAIRKKN